MTRKEFNLRRERLKRELTQEVVADGSGYSVRQYKRHEQMDDLPKRAEIVYKNYFKNISK